MSGKLYLCATPIGNLEDITLRVLRILKEVDLIAAEDTRHSLQLLNHFEIKKPMTSYHEYNKYEKAEVLIGMLKQGRQIALVTDAGTPGISDPGEVLVRRCIEEQITVTSVPGPSAVITALTMSGLSTRRFAFEAFLPSDKKERKQVLEELRSETRTIVLYEAPHRLRKTLTELKEVLGDTRRLAVIRELTKKHETREWFTLQEAVSYYEEHEPRGEYVIVLSGKDRKELKQEQAAFWLAMSVEEHVAYYEAQGNDRKAAMKLAAVDRGVSRRDIYQQLLAQTSP